MPAWPPPLPSESVCESSVAAPLRFHAVDAAMPAVSRLRHRSLRRRRPGQTAAAGIACAAAAAAAACAAAPRQPLARLLRHRRLGDPLLLVEMSLRLVLGAARRLRRRALRRLRLRRLGRCARRLLGVLGSPHRFALLPRRVVLGARRRHRLLAPRSTTSARAAAARAAAACPVCDFRWFGFSGDEVSAASTAAPRGL